MFGTGGGVLGPNGIFWAIGSYATLSLAEHAWEGLVPCVLDLQNVRTGPGSECLEGFGVVAGYRVSDGEIVSLKRLLLPGNQYPAVGPDGSGGQLMVAMSLGENPNLPVLFGPEWLGYPLRFMIIAAQARYRWVRRLLGTTKLR